MVVLKKSEGKKKPSTYKVMLKDPKLLKDGEDAFIEGVRVNGSDRGAAYRVNVTEAVLNEKDFGPKTHYVNLDGFSRSGEGVDSNGFVLGTARFPSFFKQKLRELDHGTLRESPEFLADRSLVFHVGVYGDEFKPTAAVVNFKNAVAATKESISDLAMNLPETSGGIYLFAKGEDAETKEVQTLMGRLSAYSEPNSEGVSDRLSAESMIAKMGAVRMGRITNNREYTDLNSLLADDGGVQIYAVPYSRIGVTKNLEAWTDAVSGISNASNGVMVVKTVNMDTEEIKYRLDSLAIRSAGDFIATRPKNFDPDKVYRAGARGIPDVAIWQRIENNIHGFQQSNKQEASAAQQSKPPLPDVKPHTEPVAGEFIPADRHLAASGAAAAKSDSEHPVENADDQYAETDFGEAFDGLDEQDDLRMG